MKTKLDRDEAIQECIKNGVDFTMPDLELNGWYWAKQNPASSDRWMLVCYDSDFNGIIQADVTEAISRAKVLAVLSRDEPILNDNTVTAYRAKDGTLFESREERDEYDVEKPLKDMRRDIERWLKDTQDGWTDHYNGAVEADLLSICIVKEREHILKLLQLDLEENIAAKLEASRIMVGDRDAEIVALKTESFVFRNELQLTCNRQEEMRDEIAELKEEIERLEAKIFEVER